MLLVLLVPPLVGRFYVTNILFHPGAQEWLILISKEWGPLLICGSLGVALVSYPDWVTPQPSAWQDLRVYLALGLIMLGYNLTPGKRLQGNQSNGANEMSVLPAFSNQLASGRPKEMQNYATLLRMPVRLGEQKFFAGCSATVTECVGTGLRLITKVKIEFPSSALRPWSLIPNPSGSPLHPYIRFLDGSWGNLKLSDRSFGSDSTGLAGLPAETYNIGGSYPTPLGLPWNSLTLPELLAGAELVIFVEKLSGTAEDMAGNWPAPTKKLASTEVSNPGALIHKIALAKNHRDRTLPTNDVPALQAEFEKLDEGCAGSGVEQRMDL